MLTDAVRGNVGTMMVLAPSLTPTALTASTTTSETFTIPGLQTTDIAIVKFSGSQTAGVGIADSRVSALNTLNIIFSNSTAGTPTPAAGVYYVVVMRPNQQTLPTVMN